MVVTRVIINVVAAKCKSQQASLVKWKEGANFRQQRVTIEDVRIAQFHIFGINPKNPSVVLIDEKPVADQIEFLVFGQRIIKDGNFVNFENTIDQFSDLRHIFTLPNINPEQGRPRPLYGQEQHDDVWFGEPELLEDMNLRLAALRGFVRLDRTISGASQELIEQSMRSLEDRIYRGEERIYTRSPTRPTQPGQWRFLPDDDRIVEIYLRENIYPHSILGIDQKGDVISYAWTGQYSAKPGWTIQESAEDLTGPNIVSPPIKDALLIDQGGDVFQKVWDKVTGQLVKRVPLGGGRQQMRAVFFFARKQR